MSTRPNQAANQMVEKTPAKFILPENTVNRRKKFKVRVEEKS